jgi:Ion channel
MVAFAIQGTATPARGEQVLVSVVLGATLLLALWASDVQPRLMRITVLVVVALVATSVIEAIAGTLEGGATRIANALLVGLAPPAIATGVARNLRATRAVSLQAVFGVLCIYLLLGMFFAFVYGAIDRLGGRPFFAGAQPATTAHCLYFSFTTLTTVGYGDLTARTNLGHTLSALEALLGQIYLVTIVSLIVGNLTRAPRPGGQREAP